MRLLARFFIVTCFSSVAMFSMEENIHSESAKCAFESSTLTFKTFEPGDVVDLVRLYADPDAMRYFGSGEPKEPSFVYKKLAVWSERLEGGLGHFAGLCIREKASARLVGVAVIGGCNDFGVEKLDIKNAAEYAVIVFPEFENHLTEITEAIVGFASSLIGIKTLRGGNLEWLQGPCQKGHQSMAAALMAGGFLAVKRGHLKSCGSKTVERTIYTLMLAERLAKHGEEEKKES